MGFLRSFPLLLVPIVLYNLIVYVYPWDFADAVACTNQVQRAVHPLTCELSQSLVELPTVSAMAVSESGAVEQLHWAITLGDVLLGLALVLLFLELLKSTRLQSSSLVNHALSLIVFVLGLVEFLMFPGFATSVFFLITLMALLDVLAGFIVSISTARRDVSLMS